MEQNLIEFVSKATEIILSNRWIPYNLMAHSFSKAFKNNNTIYQMKLEPKYNIEDSIPPEWSNSRNRLMVIEILLKHKLTNEKFLLEQWIFDISDINDARMRDIANENIYYSSYKKLSTLLRSISLLTKQLPLYKGFIEEKSDINLKELFNIDHHIHFTFRTVSNWHENAYNNLINYTNSDIVMPKNCMLSFKVNYTKHLKFILHHIEENEKLVKNKKLTSSLGSIDLKSETINSNSSYDEKAVDSPLCAHWCSKELSDTSLSDSISDPYSPISTQKKLIQPMEKVSLDVQNDDKDNDIKKNRLCASLGNSRKSDELDRDIEIHTASSKITKICLGAEIPKKTNHTQQPDEIEDNFGMMNILDEYEKSPVKNLEGETALFMSSKYGKIIESDDDDKIMGLINLVEDIKESFITLKKVNNISSSDASKEIYTDNNESNSNSSEIHQRSNLDNREYNRITSPKKKKNMDEEFQELQQVFKRLCY